MTEVPLPQELREFEDTLWSAWPEEEESARYERLCRAWMRHAYTALGLKIPPRYLEEEA